MDDRVIRQVEHRDAIDSLERGATLRPRVASSFAFPALLEQLREERGLTKADLAKRSDLDPSSITRFEQGARQPDRSTVLSLADAMVLPRLDRDRLLASAGFRSEIFDDPQLSELAQLLAEPEIPMHARQEARSAVRMAIAYLKLQRLQDS